MPDTTATSVETRRRARHGLAIYFAVLLPLSAVVSAIAIAKGSVNWAVPAMAVPALASSIARILVTIAMVVLAVAVTRAHAARIRPLPGARRTRPAPA